MDTETIPLARQVGYTYCSICEQVCGLKVTTEGKDVIKIEPDRENPYSWRDFCIKASTADAIRSHPSRIRTPMRRVGDHYEPATYEEAIANISERLSAIIDRHGVNAVGAYTGNPSGFSFNNSVFHGAFMDALGSRQRFWVGSIDQNAFHYVAEAMYGSPWASLVPDVENCECFLLIGTNPAISGMNWVGSVSDGWRRIVKAAENGADLIVVDPRRTESAKSATLHVAPLPEQDWAFLLAVIRFVFDNNWINSEDCAEAVGVDHLRAIAAAADLNKLSEQCGVALSVIEDVAWRFGQAQTAMCVARTGPAQGKNGALTEWLSQALNLITGRTDRKGGRCLNYGPVNLMELGKTMFTPVTEPSRVRGLDPIVGSYSLAELPGEILTPGPGQVRALILNSGNPVVAGPDGAQLDEALESLELLVAVDLLQRESHRHADWLIPGLHFLERTELHILIACLHDVPFIQQSSKVVEPPEGVRPEWQFYRDLAAALGLQMFGGQMPPDPDILTNAFLKTGGRVDPEEVVKHPHSFFYAEKQTGLLRDSLQTADKRIQACPNALAELLKKRMAELIPAPSGAYQIITKRRLQMMNSWLAEASGAKIRNDDGDTVEINVADAKRDGLESGAKVMVKSSTAHVEAKVLVSEDVRPGVAVMEHGWGSRTFNPATGKVASIKGINRNALVSNTDLDPLTGVPRLNGTPVTIKPVQGVY